MPHIRTTKTASSSRAVQVVSYTGDTTRIIAHIGSAKNDHELALLRKQAEDFIESYTGQQSLFPDIESGEDANNIIQTRYARTVGIKYNILKDTLRHLFTLFNFDDLNNQLLLDLVLARIAHPSSKRESVSYLKNMFGINHSETEVYRLMSTCANMKGEVEEKVIAFAKKHLDYSFTVVFYDVTTLYFETFAEDPERFKKPGFSKDNKSNQPQIVIGLIVNHEGFPVSFDVYAGNTFEGHTLIPSLTSFKEKYQVKSLTVVADAAMISFENIEELKRHGIDYIVGARLGNLPDKTTEEISNYLDMMDGATYRLETDKGTLVCDFSKKRYWKSKHEMEQQIKKARTSEATKDKRLKLMKFLKNTGEMQYELNEPLIAKTTRLLGIKGYYTNRTEEYNEAIIYKYRNLWRVEKSFRMAKSDLQARPIFHFKNEAIQGHILICFMALAVSTYLEIATKQSLQHILKLLKSAVEAQVKDGVTGRMVTIKPEIHLDVQELWSKLRFTY